MTLKKGQIVYLLQSSYVVRKAQIVRFYAGFYTLRFLDGAGGIRVRRSRIFTYPDEAQACAERHQDYASLQLRYTGGL